jgi:Domain of unknown function (DUF5615)
MRVLLDEMVSRKLARELIGHEVSTVQRQGWAGLTNGRLLDVIDSLFDALITMDKGMQHQQRLAERPFGIIELYAPSSDIDDVIPLVPQILEALAALQRDDVAQLTSMIGWARRQCSPRGHRQ